MNYFVIFGLIILLFSGSLVLSSIVIKRLKTTHSETWEALGRPVRIDLSSKVTPEGKPFWVTGYKELNDPKFESQVEFLKLYNNVFGTIAVVFLILMVVKLVLGYR